MAEDKFDESILVNILSRIPTDSVLTSKTTCKTWEALIKDPYFIRSHTHILLSNYYHSVTETQDDSATKTVPRPPLCFVYVLGGRYAGHRDTTLYIGEYCYESKQITQKQLNCAPIHSRVTFAGSCNGLVCLAVPVQCTIRDPIYVFNPITREYVNLPRFSKNRYLKGVMAYGFGYYPPTQEYKVVRIFYGSNKEVGWLQVYTLGNPKGKWKNKGEVSYSLKRPRGVLCNGALHWFSDNWIMSFDLGDEEFRMLPLGPPFDVNSSCSASYKLGELNGCLYVTHRKDDEYVDLWTLRKKKNQTYDVDEYFWTKDFRIECKFYPEKYFTPVSISENRSTLLLWSYGRHGVELVEHNQKCTKVLKLLNDDYKHMDFIEEFEGVTCIKSLVSLKALGENAKLMEAKGSVDCMNVKGDATKQVPLLRNGSRVKGDGCSSR